MMRLADLRSAFRPSDAWPVSFLLVALWLAAPASAATLYDEAVGGDLTADEGAAPVVGMLVEGENSVFGTMGDFGDAFRVELGTGLEILGIDVLVSSYAGSALGFGRARLSQTNFVDIDEVDFDGDGTYPFDVPPLPAAVYLLKIFGGGEVLPGYAWEVRLTLPEPAGGALAALGALVALAWSRRR